MSTITVIHTIVNSVCRKREAHIIWSMVIAEKAVLVTGSTLETTGTVLADSRQ